VTATDADPRKSFNSLSRDHEVVITTEDIYAIALAFVAFNSLSRDHAEGLKLLEDLPETTFQLPLSGSPSPIPGFFGSPRLSAAAPLRTNEF
jgi:hypothetical protein